MRRLCVAFIAASIAGTTLTVVGAGFTNQQSVPPTKTKTQEPVVTPVAGPSWLNRLGLRYSDTSLGRSGATYGPPPTQRPSPPGAARLALGRPVELSGADLYRLNCQSCHRAEGTGTPPEIKSVLGLVQGSSLKLVQQHLQKEGPASAGSAARAGRSSAGGSLPADSERRPTHAGACPPAGSRYQRRLRLSDTARQHPRCATAVAPDHKLGSARRISSKGTCHISP